MSALRTSAPATRGFSFLGFRRRGLRPRTRACSDPVACSLLHSTPPCQTSTSRTPCGFSTSPGGSLLTSSGKRPTEISESLGLAGGTWAPAGGCGAQRSSSLKRVQGCSCPAGPLGCGDCCYPARLPGARVSLSPCILSVRPVGRGGST